VLEVLTVRVLKVLVVLLMLTGCGDLRVKMGVFNNVDEARRDGAIDAGA
jgi:hypothetical protein